MIMDTFALHDALNQIHICRPPRGYYSIIVIYILYRMYSYIYTYLLDMIYAII